MKKIYLVVALLMGSYITSYSQSENENFGLEFNGFVKNDVFYDTRQTISAREGHFLLWPAPENPGVNGDDISAKSNLNMLALQSILSGTITGTEAFGAKTMGKIEGDFFAQANDNINLFRLRHAFVQLSWENTQLLFGQYWNPLFVTDCFPGTVSFNTGSPIQPFARNPQVRITHSLGKVKILAAALGQRDYTSRGAAGPTSDYLRNSAVPDMHLQLHYKGSKLVSGAGMAYKNIVPRLETDNGYKTSEKVSGLTLIAFSKLSLEPVTIKFEAVSGQNTPDVLNISGFAVETIDAATDERTYLPLRNLSLWTDIQTNGDKFQVGLFAGYSRNRGTTKNIYPAEIIYGLGTDIASLYRISPRVLFNSGKVRFGLEGEFTSATFGSAYNEYAVPENTHTVNNMRILFSTYYFF